MIGRMTKVPAQAALIPIYQTSQVNDSIVLYSGPMELKTNAGVIRGEGTIKLDWLPHPSVRFTVPLPAGGWPDLGGGDLMVPNKGTAKVTVTMIGGHSNEASGHLREPFETGSGSNLKEVRFHLPNFLNYHGKALTDGSMGFWSGRTILEGQGWRITLDAVRGLGALKKELDGSGGFAITHSGILERGDGLTFTSEDAKEVLEPLSYLLSFARGHWTPAILAVGYDSSQGRVWESLEPWWIDPWGPDRSWFPVIYPECLGEIFPGFLQRWQNPTWNEPIRWAVQWYTAVMKSAQLESAIVHEQVALEMLSWVLLVEDLKTESPAAFDKENASRKIHKLLTHAAIPTNIPPELTDLASLAAAPNNWTSGPHALAGVRNKIVHPTAKNMAALSRVSMEGRADALNLGAWYLELLLLWLFSYQRVYYNRITGGSTVTVDTVPWAPPPAPPVVPPVPPAAGSSTPPAAP